MARLVALSSDGLFLNKQESEVGAKSGLLVEAQAATVFREVSTAACCLANAWNPAYKGYASLKEKVTQVLDRAGGGSAAKNKAG